MKNSLLEAMAGKQRANILASVLSDASYLRSAYESSATDYVGSAQQELDKYLDSITAKLQQFTNEVHSFWTGLIDSEVVKFFIDIGSQLLKVVNNVGQLNIVVSGLLSLLATKKIGAFTTVFVDGNKQLNIFNKSVKEVGLSIGSFFKTINSNIKGKANGTLSGSIFQGLFTSGSNNKLIPELTDQYNAFSSLMKENVGKSAAQVAEELGGVDKRVVDYIDNTKAGERSSAGFAASLANISLKSKIASIGVSALSGAFNILLGFAISFVGSKLITAFDNYIHRIDKAKEAVRDLESEFKNSQSSIESHEKTIDSIKDRYETLSKGVDKFGNNISLTTEEFNEYHDITKQIYDMYPNLITGFTEQGNAIDGVRGSVEKLNEALNTEKLLAYNKVLEGSDSVIKNYNLVSTGGANGSNQYRADFFKDILNAYMSSSDFDEYSRAADELFEKWVQTTQDGGAAIIALYQELYNSIDKNAVLSDENAFNNNAFRGAFISALNTEIASAEVAMNDAINSVVNDVLLPEFWTYMLNNEDSVLNNNEDLNKFIDAFIRSINSNVINEFYSGRDARDWVDAFLGGIESAMSNEAVSQELSDALSNLFGNGLNKATLTPIEYSSRIQDSISTIINALNLDDTYASIFEKIIDIDKINNEAKNYKAAIGKLSSFFKLSNVNMVAQLESDLKNAGILTSDSINDFFNVITDKFERGEIDYVEAIDLYKKEVKSRFEDIDELTPLSSLLSDSDTKDKISSFQSNIKQLGDAIANFSSLSPENKLDIYSTYAKSLEEMGFSGELTVDVLQKLAKQQWNTVEALFDGVEGADEYKKALRALMDQALNTARGFNETIKSIGLPENLTDLNYSKSDYDRMQKYADGQKKLLEYTKNFTDAQKEHWSEITSGAKDANEAISMFEDDLKNLQFDSLQDILADDVFKSLKDGAEEISGILKDGITGGEEFTLLTKYGLTSEDVRNGAAKDLERWFEDMMDMYLQAGGDAGKEWKKGWKRELDDNSDTFNRKDFIKSLGIDNTSDFRIRDFIMGLSDEDYKVFVSLDIDENTSLDTMKKKLANAKTTLSTEGLLNLELQVNGDTTTISSYISDVQSKAKTLQSVIFDLTPNRDGTRNKTWSDIVGDYDTYSQLTAIVPTLARQLKDCSTETEATETAIRVLTDASSTLYTEFEQNTSAILDINNLTLDAKKNWEDYCAALKDTADANLQARNGLKDVADSLDKIYFDDVADDARSFAQAISDTESELDTLNNAYTKLIDSSLRENSVEFKKLVADLVQQFPELANSTGSIKELSAAVAELMGTKGNDLIIALENLRSREGIPDELRDKIDALIDSFHKLSTQPFSMDNAINVIKNAREELNQLANFVRKVNETGLHLDVSASDDVYNLYPELLKNAKLYKDGTIELNKDVYENFKKAKELEVQGDIQARIKELEAANKQAEAEIEFEKTKLGIVNEALKSKSSMKMQVALAEIEAMEAEAKANAEMNKEMASNDAEEAEAEIESSGAKTEAKIEGYNEVGETAADHYTQQSEMDAEFSKDEVENSNDVKDEKVEDLETEGQVFDGLKTMESEQDETVSDQIQTNSANTSDTVQENAITAGETTTDVMADISEGSVGTAESVDGNSEALKTNVGNNFLDIGQTGEDTAEKISSDFAGGFYSSKVSAADMGDNAATTFNGIINRAHEVAKAVAGALKGEIAGSTGKSGSSIGSTLTGFVSGVKNSISSVFSGAKNAGSKLLDATSGLFGGLFNGAKTNTSKNGYSSFAKDISAKVSEGIKKGVTSAADALTASTTKLGQIVADAGNNASTLIDRTKQFLYNAKNIDQDEIVDKFLDTVQKIGDRITKNVTPKENVDKYKDLVKQLGDIANTSTNRIEELMKYIADNNEIIEWLKANGGLELQEFIDRLDRESNPGSNSTGRDSSPTGSSSDRSPSSSTSDDVEEKLNEFSEIIDWIEIKLQRIAREIQKLDKIAGNSFQRYSTRAKSISMNLDRVMEQMDTLEAGYKRYMQEAANVGLDPHYAKLVREGTIDIEEITDEALKEQIEMYQKWYELAQNCLDELYDSAQKVSALHQEAFDLIQNEASAILTSFENEVTMINNAIQQTQDKGYLVSEGYYRSLMENTEAQMRMLETERNELLREFQAALNDGSVEEGSESWWNYKNSIDAVTVSMQELTSKQIEYNNAIRQLQWDRFDLTQSRISELTSEADFLISLMSNKTLYNDEGYITNSGLATKAMHGLNYNTNMALADEYHKEMLRINDDLAKDPNNQVLYNRRKELLELQRESILAAEAEKNEIQSLVKDGIEKAVSAMQKLINQYNQLLDSEKSLYDYQKNINNQNKNIANLQKQLTSLAGDDSEENRKKLQELNNQLAEAEQTRDEALWDHAIQETKDLLNKLYSDYDETLNARLDNLDVLIAENIAQINLSAGQIADTLDVVAGDVGYKITNKVDEVFKQADSNLMPALAMYSSEYMHTLTNERAVLTDQLTGQHTSLIDNITSNAARVSDYIYTMSNAMDMDLSQANSLIGESIYGIQGVDLRTQNLDGTTRAGFEDLDTDTIWGFNSVTSGMLSFREDFGSRMTTINSTIQSVGNQIESMVKSSQADYERQISQLKADLEATKLKAEANSAAANGDGVYDKVAKVDALVAEAMNNPKSTALSTALDKLTNSTLTGTKTAATAMASANSANTASSSSSSSSIKGDGVPRVGDLVTYFGKYFWSSNGVDPAYDFDAGKVGGAKIVDIAPETQWWHPTHPYLIELTNPKYKGYTGWVSLDQLSGYASGAMSIPFDQLAEINERGSETIVTPDGRILTPLARKSMVIDAKATQNMWRMLQDPDKFVSGILENSNIVTNNNAGNIENNISITIPIAHVDDANDLMSQLQSSEKFQRLFDTMLDSSIKGSSKFNKYNVNFNRR